MFIMIIELYQYNKKSPYLLKHYWSWKRKSISLRIGFITIHRLKAERDIILVLSNWKQHMCSVKVSKICCFVYYNSIYFQNMRQTYQWKAYLFLYRCNLMVVKLSYIYSIYLLIPNSSLHFQLPSYHNQLITDVLTVLLKFFHWETILKWGTFFKYIRYDVVKKHRIRFA